MFSFIANIYEKNQTYTLDFDTYIENFKIDESLDSAILVIPRLQKKTEFRRFAPVNVQVSDGTNTISNWWLIYTPKLEISAKANKVKYDHTLGLIEPTKWLEKFPCGSLTFTQPIGGTRYTMLDVVNRLRNLTPFVPYASVSTTRLFTINSTLATYLSTIEAPQLYFDKKNLREALVLTFKYINAIPRLVYNGSTWILTADFVNNRRLEIDVNSGIIDYTSEMSGENFGSKAEIYHENTIPTEDETQTSVYSNSVTDYKWINAEDLTVGDSNFRIETTFDIYKLLSIKAIVPTTVLDYTLDITDCVPEKKVYDTLDYDNGLGTKSHSGYWTYGTNIIDGFNQAFQLFSDKLALRNIIEAKLALVSRTIDGNWNVNKTAFLIEYIPYINLMRSEQYREDVEGYTIQDDMQDKYATLQVNPQERINSLYQLTNNVYGLIQRLGVETVAFSKKHKTLASYDGSNDGIYEVGDYTNDGFFITNKEVAWFNTFAIARYEMSRNWNRYAQFIQIDKEFRPYEIALTKSDFTLKRLVNMQPFVIEIDNASNVNHTAGALVVPFMNTLRDSTYEMPFYSVVIKKSLNGTSFDNNACLLPLAFAQEKNTIKFKVDMRDTKVAGKRSESKIVSLLEIQRQLAVNYTYDDGTLPFVSFEFYKSYWDWVVLTKGTVNGDVRLIKIFKATQVFPYVDLSANIISVADSPTNSFLEYALSVSNFASLPTFAPAGSLYYTLDTLTLYQSNGVSPTSSWTNVSTTITAVKKNKIWESAVYNIDKDPSEVMGFEFQIPIIPKKDKVNRYVIGDSLIKENVILKQRDSGKNIGVWIMKDGFRFDKARTQMIQASDLEELSPYTPTITNNYVRIPTDVLASNKNFCLADEDYNLYLGVNRVNLDGTVEASANVEYIYFNFLAERSE